MRVVLCVKHKKGTKVLNGCKVFVLPLHVISRPPPHPGRHIRLGNENVVSRRGEEGSEPVNLSGRSDTSSQCWQSAWCHTSQLCPSLLPQLLFLQSYPTPPHHHYRPCRAEYFHVPWLSKTLLTATVRASKWGKCVRWVCDVVFKAPGYAEQTALVSQGEQTTKKE